MVENGKSTHIVTSIRHKLLSGGAWVTAGQFSTLLLGFVVSIILTRILSVQDMGAYFLALSFIAVITTVFSLGLPLTIVRMVAQYMANEHFLLVRKIIILALVASTASGVVAYAFVLLFGSWITQHFLGTLALVALMPQIGFLVFIGLLRGLIAQCFMGFHDYRFTVLFGGMISSLLTAMILVMLWRFEGNSNIAQVLYISIASVSVSLGLALVFIFRKLKISRNRHDSIVLKENPFKEMFSVSWGMWLVGIVLLLLSSADLWIVSAFGSEKDVALYGIAARLTIVVTVFHTISVAVIQPIISNLHTKGDRGKLERVVRTVASVAFVPSFIISVVLVIFARDLLSIVYGDYYAQAGEVLVILSLSRLIVMFFGPIGMIQLMTGLQIYYLAVSILAGGIGVLLAILLMPSYGIVGVAYAWLLSGTIYGILNFLVIWRKLNIKSYISPMILYNLVRSKGKM